MAEPDIAGEIAQVRHIIAERGWCQDDSADEYGRVCIGGARAAALGSKAGLVNDPVLRFLALRTPQRDEVAQDQVNPYRAVSKFNDLAEDQAAIMEFLIEAQLAARSTEPKPRSAHRWSARRPSPF